MTLVAGTRGPGIPANGQILYIEFHLELYHWLGNKYGGDGINTFQLPDMRAITPNEMTWYICHRGISPTEL